MQLNLHAAATAPARGDTPNSSRWFKDVRRGPGRTVTVVLDLAVGRLFA